MKGFRKPEAEEVPPETRVLAVSEEGRPLSPEDARRLAEYIEGRLSPAERKEVEREILARPEMAAALYADGGIQSILEEEAGAAGGRADDDVAAPARGLPFPPRMDPGAPGRWLGIGLPIAALLVLGLLTPQLIRMGQRGTAGRGGPESEEDFRFRSGAAHTTTDSGGDGEVSTRPRGLSPSGEVPSPPTHFVWTRDPGARLYRLEVQDETGRLLFFRMTRDTSVAVPEKAVEWGEVRSASWRVVPLVSRAERTPSGTVEFQIVPK
jgi:hypothetical protein